MSTLFDYFLERDKRRAPQPQPDRTRDILTPPPDAPLQPPIRDINALLSQPAAAPDERPVLTPIARQSDPTSSPEFYRNDLTSRMLRTPDQQTPDNRLMPPQSAVPSPSYPTGDSSPPNSNVEGKIALQFPQFPDAGTPPAVGAAPVGTPDSQPVDIAQAYEQAGGVPYSTIPDKPVAPPKPNQPPNFTGTPLEIERQRQAWYADPANKPTNQDHGFFGRLKDVLREAVISGGQAYNNATGTPEQRLAAGLGGMGGGAFIGGFHPQANEERQRLVDINRSRQYENVLQQQDDELKHAAEEEQKRRLGEADISKTNAEAQWYGTGREQAAQNKAQQQALAQLNRMRIFDPTNPAHAAIATAAGQDPKQMKAWDFTKPDERTVNGITFMRDKTTGQFNPTNLPVSEKDKIVPISFTDPNTGEKTTYNVPQSKAEQTTQQMTSLGMRLNSSEKRAANAQAGATTRMQLSGQIKQGLAEYQAAERAKNIDAMNAAREKLARLKAQLTLGETGLGDVPDQQ
jgi:hypothetical protein